MDQPIAFCGLDCSKCEAYQATQAGDPAALEAVAARWREQFQSPLINAGNIACDGCLVLDGRKAGYCTACEIRTCALERGVAHCAVCPDATCAKLEGFFDMDPGARENFTALRVRLLH